MMLMPGCVSGAGRFIYNIPPSLRCLLHGIFGGFVRIVYTQFPEDILPVAVYRMEAEVSFGGYFFGCFPQGYLF